MPFSASHSYSFLLVPVQQVLEHRLLFEFLQEIISFVAVAERDIVYRLRATFKKRER